MMSAAANQPMMEMDDDDVPEFDRTEEEYADEMQRELGDDAPWKRIQQNTFTRWANEHLKLVGRPINSLEHDLSDGLALIALIEVLSQRKLPRHNRRPAFRSQKLENVSVALDFLENNERIRLVNIDASHIVDGRLKLILGLIWTLILHYSIQLSTWEGVYEDDMPGKDLTPKQKLMNWLKNMLPPNVPINNFTTDWNDGRAIGALVNACAPGLFPQWEKCDPNKRLESAKAAMDLAEEHLGIPQLVRPHEIIDPNVDERSMMTYLSQFPNAKGRSGQLKKPIHAPTAVPRQLEMPRGPVRCYGKGIEPTGNQVNEPTQFYADTTATGISAPIEVKVINPHGFEEPCAIDERSGGLFTCSYVPTMEGPYRIIVKHGQQEVPGSPFTTLVTGAPPSSVPVQAEIPISTKPFSKTAFGPGIGPDSIPVNKPTWFEVQTNGGPELRTNEASVYDPSNRSVPVQGVKTRDPRKVHYKYTPTSPGLHSIEIPNVIDSPFRVPVVPDATPIVKTATGPGIGPNPIYAREPTWFDVRTNGDRPLPINEARVFDPMMRPVPVEGNETGSPQTVRYKYTPTTLGDHTVDIPNVVKSPFQVPVVSNPENARNCHAYGRGLQPSGNRIGDLSDFKVTTVPDQTGPTECPRIMVTGPDHRQVPCTVNQSSPNTWDCAYVPEQQGEHKVNVDYEGHSIPGSPFHIDVGPHKESNIRAYGPGLEGGVAKQPADFIVETNGETGTLGFAIEGPSQTSIECNDMGDASAKVRYVPTAPGEYAVHIMSNEEDIPKSPYMVWIDPEKDASFNPANVRVYGPGVDPDVTQLTGSVSEFAVDQRNAGPGELKVSCHDTRHEPVRVTDTLGPDGIHKCQYVPQIATPHKIWVSHGKVATPNSPYKVNVRDMVSGPLATAYGPGVDESIGIMPSEPTYFEVDTSKCNDPYTDIAVRVAGADESGHELVSIPVDIEKGRHPKESVSQVRYTGPAANCRYAKVDVRLVQDQYCSVNRNPFMVPINRPPPQTAQLHSQSMGFKIPTGGSFSDLSAHIVTPSGRNDIPLLEDNGDGTVCIKYQPTEPGTHVLYVFYMQQPIPGSPYKFHVEKVDSSRSVQRVYAYGSGLSGGIKDSQCSFKIVTREAGVGNLSVAIEGPSKAEIICNDNKDGCCDVQWYPAAAGEYVISIQFANEHIVGSPFTAIVRDVGLSTTTESFQYRQSTFDVPSVQMTSQHSRRDASTVNIYGTGIESIDVNKINVFTVDTSSILGVGDLSVNIEGPSKADIRCERLPGKGSSYRISYTVTRAGQYVVSVRLNGIEVSGSPFLLHAKAVGEPIERVGCFRSTDAVRSFAADSSLISSSSSFMQRNVSYETSNVSGGSSTRALKSGYRVNEPVSLSTSLQSALIGEIDAYVVRPDGSSTSCMIQRSLQDDSHYVMKFVPQQSGLHKIHVRLNGNELIDSPFSVMVSPSGVQDIGTTDVSNITVHGDGLRSAVVGERSEFMINTGVVGLCTLAVTIDGPSRVELECHEVENGYRVSYVPNSQGEYLINIRVGSVSIPGSPFTCHVTGTGTRTLLQSESTATHSVARAQNVRAFGQGLMKAFRNQTATFQVDASSGGDSVLMVGMHGKDTMIPCDSVVVKHEGDNLYSVSYNVTHRGHYILVVKWDDCHIPGSPFYINVD